jgi:hypothetical protein
VPKKKKKRWSSNEWYLDTAETRVVRTKLVTVRTNSRALKTLKYMRVVG